MDPTRQRVLDLLRRHGRDAVSFQVLEPGLEYWFDGSEACVAYARVDDGRAWVAAGGPVAARDQEVAVLSRFVAAARAAGKRVRLFGIERDLSVDGGFGVTRVGVQPIWDPQRWATTLAGHRSLREQLRRARRKGVTIRLVAADEVRVRSSPTRIAVDALIERWLATRAMAPMRFVVSLAPYDLPEERMFLVAERGADLVGILVAVPIYARGGYLFEDVLRDPHAPNGTVELLFDDAMRRLAAIGCDHATFGLAPLAGVESRPLRLARRLGRRLYDFDGLWRFKQKLGPNDEHAVFIVYPLGSSGVGALVDVLRAFAGGSLLRFGLQTIVHRAPDVARVLAALLVAWIAVLGLLPVDPWFPSATVKLAWLAIDAVMVVGLFALASRWRGRLATTLALIASLDCVLGTVQALLWNLPNANLSTELVAIAGALTAPLGAAAFLFLSRDR